jgi:hypothetical protein
LGKLADDESLDVGPVGFLVVQIGADVSDVRIGEADDLPGVARVGEDFLVTGKAGIENNFAAAAGERARRAPAKGPSVFQCKCSEACG